MEFLVFLYVNVSVACVQACVCMPVHVMTHFCRELEGRIHPELSFQHSNKRDAAAALIDREEIEVSHETR